MNLRAHSAELIAGGSDTFRYSCASLAHGTTAWYDVHSLFPKARQFLPLDYLEVVNNTMCALTIYLNSASESFSCPASNIKTIQKPYLRLGIKNEDNAQAAANITLHMRKLPAQGITKMVQG